MADLPIPTSPPIQLEPSGTRTDAQPRPTQAPTVKRTVAAAVGNLLPSTNAVQEILGQTDGQGEVGTEEIKLYALNI